MEIYKYNIGTKEWHDIVNSNLKSKEKDKAIDNYIKTHGQKVSLQEYFKDSDRNVYDWRHPRNSFYKCFGNAENCLERLAKEETDYDEELNYCSAKNNHPEDLVEERTDWGKMKSYADGLADFISLLKSEIADGTLTINTISE